MLHRTRILFGLHCTIQAAKHATMFALAWVGMALARHQHSSLHGVYSHWARPPLLRRFDELMLSVWFFLFILTVSLYVTSMVEPVLKSILSWIMGRWSAWLQDCARRLPCQVKRDGSAKWISLMRPGVPSAISVTDDTRKQRPAMPRQVQHLGCCKQLTSKLLHRQRLLLC